MKLKCNHDRRVMVLHSGNTIHRNDGSQCLGTMSIGYGVVTKLFAPTNHRFVTLGVDRSPGESFLRRSSKSPSRPRILIEWLEIHSRAMSDVVSMSQSPTYAYLSGKGKVRILEYVGNDTFRVLTNRDETIRVNRARLTFIKEKR